MSDNSCFNSKLPCWRFLIASTLSIAAFTTGTVMCIMLPANHGLIPFWSSMITTSLAVWVKMPEYNEKKKATLGDI